MTPIDPTDVPELLRIYEAGATRRSAERDGIAWMETHKGLLAVARAVCPEHHAVYDTRTHVSVPIADIEDWIVAADECRVQKQWPVRGVPSEFHFPWLDESTEVAKLQGIETWLRSLLPKEEAND